jgi:hypothetical protein
MRAVDVQGLGRLLAVGTPGVPVPIPPGWPRLFANVGFGDVNAVYVCTCRSGPLSPTNRLPLTSMASDVGTHVAAGPEIVPGKAVPVFVNPRTFAGPGAVTCQKCPSSYPA